MKEIRESEFVFAGGKRGKPLSNMAMLAVLKRMGRGDLTGIVKLWSRRCASRGDVR